MMCDWIGFGFGCLVMSALWSVIFHFNKKLSKVSADLEDATAKELLKAMAFAMSSDGNLTLSQELGILKRKCRLFISLRQKSDTPTKEQMNHWGEITEFYGFLIGKYHGDKEATEYINGTINQLLKEFKYGVKTQQSS